METTSSMETTKRSWEPMRLRYVGNVGQLMQGGTGSRQESGNLGFDKGQGNGKP